MHPLLIFALTLAGHGAAGLLWARWLLPKEVAKNDADFTADGSNDSLRKAYHLHRMLVRAGWGALLVLGASLPCVGSWQAYVGSCLALAVLLATYFARYFTPLLNLARVASGRTDLSEWYCSSDSASWPDAAVYKKIRAMPAGSLFNAPPVVARQLLEQLLKRTWWQGLAVYALLLVGLFFTIR